MTTERFWYYIDLANAASQEQEAQSPINILTDILAVLEAEMIYGFESRLQKTLKDLEQPIVLKNFQRLYPATVHSNDAFLYFRCWLIGQGKDLVNQLLGGKALEKEALPQLEALLYVADEAFRKSECEGVLPRERR